MAKIVDSERATAARARLLEAWPDSMSGLLREFIPTVVSDFVRAHGADRARKFFLAAVDYVEARLDDNTPDKKAMFD